ncbi:MAG: PAS domain-containing protein [Planctomycetia bacterium]|nr:PAS domain-containing protein [Planctomycetia bacterium]MCC7316127.1 PAS domain-containing protein [Planctomycetota bacterium]OQZ00948.1 MAG: hypothetical protein B6D36_14515 [Planctomycetes bacterium UTPLA1]
MGVSLALQIAASLISFRLTRLVGPRYGWILLGTALGLMAVRRGITFFRLVMGDMSHPPDPAAELVALAISICSVTALAYIAPLFRNIHRTSESLRASEGRLRVALEAGAMTTWEWDVQADAVTWGSRVSEVLGVPADNPPLCSAEFYKLVLPQDLPGFQRAAETAAEERRNLDTEFRIVRPDNGQTCWIAAKGKFLLDAEDRPAKMIGVNFDITPSKDASEQIRAGDERFRLLIDAIQDYAIHMLDLKGHVSTWNEGAHRIWGYTSEEIMGSDFSVFFTPEDLAARMPDRSLRIADSKGRYASEGWRLAKGRRMFWAETLITPIRDAKGVQTGYARVTRNLTEKKQAEDALRETQLRLQIAQDIARISTWTWDPKSDQVEVTDNWRKNLGELPERQKMSFDQWVETIHPNDRSRVQDTVRGGMTSGTPYQVTFRTMQADAKECHMRAWGQPYIDSAGRVIKITGVTQDITDQVLAGKAMADAKPKREA